MHSSCSHIGVGDGAMSKTCPVNVFQCEYNLVVVEMYFHRDHQLVSAECRIAEAVFVMRLCADSQFCRLLKNSTSVLWSVSGFKLDLVSRSLFQTTGVLLSDLPFLV